MNDKVQRALDARKNRKEAYAPSLTPSNDKVKKALEARQNRIESTADEDVNRIYRRYENAVNSYNRHASDNEIKFGTDAAKSIDKFRGDSVALSELSRDVEAYRKYIGDENADSMLKSLSKLKDGYGAMYSNAAMYSQFASENEYDKALRYVGYKTKYDAMTEKERADSLSELNGKRTSSDISEGDARRYQEEYDWILGSYEDDAVKKEARKNTYEENERRIAEIDKEIAAVMKRGGGIARLSSDEVQALESEKASLEAENTLYRRTQEVMDKYSEYTKNEDFGTVSARRDFANPSKEELITFDSRNANAGYTLDAPVVEDKLGMYLSSDEKEREEAYGYQPGENQWADTVREGVAGSWSKLTEGEVDTYYYILNSQGKDAADKYLSDMTVELNRRENEDNRKEIDNAGALEKIALSVASVPANVYGGVVGFAEDVANTVTGKDINPYSAAHGASLFASNVRDSTSEAIAKATEGLEINGQNIPEFLYQTGMSMADSMLGAATMGNAYTYMMGTNAAASEAKRLYEEGASKTQIAAGGLLAGAAEAVFEKLSLDRLLKEKDIRSVGQLVKEILAQGGVEASEEVFTEITNKLTNQLVMGANSDYSKAVEAYIDEGKSRSEAEALAFMDSVGDVIWAGAGGFISGAGMGAAFDTVQYHNNLANEGRTVIGQKGTDSLKALALEMAKQEGVNKDKLTGLSDKVGEKASAKNVGKLSFAVENASRAQNIAEIKRSLTDDGMSAREAGKTAKTLYSALDGEYYEDSFANKLDPENSSYDEKTANTYYSMIGNDESSVNKRNDKYALARRGITVNDKGESVLSDALAKDTIEKAANEVALSKISSQNRFDVNTGTVNAEDDAVIPMTAEEAERFKGKTTVYDAETDTHREVKIAGVHSIKDGEMMLKLDDGSVVNARDVRYASDEEAVLYNAALDMGVNAGVAQALINNYDKADGVSAGKYVLGIRDAYFYGKMNIPLKQLSENSFAHDLTAAQREFAYKLGQTEAKAEAKSKQKAIDEKMAEAKKKGEVQKKSGKLIVEDGVAVDENGSIDESVLTDVQKANLIGVKALAELSPINFHVFRSEKVDGEYRYTMPDGSVMKANGVYMVGSNDIWIDLNAGDMGEGTMLWTASHEISHYIKERAPVRWKAMADYLVKEYSKKQDVSLSELLDGQKSKVLAREGSDSLSEAEITDAAYEELVSDALSDMLTDGSVIEALAEIKKTDRGLWQTIKDAVAALLERWGEVLGIYKGRTPDAAEAQALSGMKEAYKKLQKMYAEAFAEANAVEEAIGDELVRIDDTTESVSPVPSERNTGSMSNRVILANAIESSVQTEIERKKLQDYRENIDSLYENEAKLSELNRQIKELSFAEGKRDTKKLKELREEAVKTANRINIYDKKLLRLEPFLSKVLDREKVRVRKQEKTKYKASLAEYREKRDAREEAMKAKWKESREKASVKRKASVVRDKIKSLKTKMEEDLQKPTERRYVPARLVGAIVDVCGLINTDTPLIKNNGEVSRAQEKRNQTKEKLQALKDEYEKLQKDADPMYKGEYDETVYAYLSKLKDDYADKNLSDMSLEELTQLYDILRSVYETLRDARKLIGQNEAQSVYEVGDSIAAEQASIAKSRKKDKRSPAQKAKDKSYNYTLSPVRNVERMSGYNEDSALVQLFRDFERGIRKKNMFVMESYKMFQALSTGENSSVYEDAIYKGYGDKTYTDIHGRRFAVSKMEMMQAILTLEREEANNEIHLQKDGISFADLTMLGKGRLKDAVSEEYSHRVPAAVEMIKGFAEELKNDAWAQAYMAAARSFFNEKAKNAINETTMITKHRVIAATKNYIPKEVDRKFITREISAENDIQQTINSYGMLKDTVKNASQPLIMTGLNNVIDRHIEQVGNVYGLSVPVRNFNKVWNVRTNEGRDTVKSLIEKYWGTEGANSIEQTVRDIQGPRINNQSDMYRKLRSNYIGATFLLNLSVVSKQIGSLFAANSMLKYRGPIRMLYNLGYTMKNYKKLSAEVDKYTASVWMRRQGVSDGELYSLMTQGKKSFFGKLNNKLPESIRPTSWIAGMDSAVALSLWKYAKEDVAKRTGLKGEELLKATADYFDSVIENTQSMADVLHRPEVQKRGDLASDILGMFKTDLYQMAGQLNVTFGRFMANKTAENRAALGRTIYSVAMSAIWGQLMSVLFSFIRYKVKPFRDDDTDEVTFGGVMKRSLFGLLGDLAGYVIPLAGSEAVGVVENIVYGESDEIADNIVTSAVNSLYDAILRTAGKIRDGKSLSVSDFSSIATKALQLAGVPANNLYRFGQSINLYAKDIANGEMFSYNAGAELTTANRMSRITNAYTSGKTEMAKNMYEDYLEELAISKANGEEVTDEAINEAKSNLKSALGKKYKDGDIERESVVDMLEELFGMDDEDIYWTMDKWDYAAENGSADDYEKYGEFYEAVETGVKLKAVIKRYTDNGVANKTLAAHITKYYKPKYRAMTKGERAAIKGYLLNAYVYLGYDRSKKSKDIDAWLKEDDEED